MEILCSFVFALAKRESDCRAAAALKKKWHSLADDNQQQWSTLCASGSQNEYALLQQIGTPLNFRFENIISWSPWIQKCEIVSAVKLSIELHVTCEVKPKSQT